MKKKKIQNPIIIWIIILLPIVGIPALVIHWNNSRYNSKETIEKILKVKSKSEVEKLLEENDVVPFGEVDKKLMLLRIDLWRVFGKPLKDETLKAIIDCLSDKKIVKKYHLYAPVKNIVVVVITSDYYTQDQKEYVVKSLNVVPDRLSSLKDYFLKPENQIPPFFPKYISWCLSQDYFYPLFEMFDNMSLDQQMEVLNKINPDADSNSDYDKKSQITFLKKVTESNQYDDKVRTLAKEKLNKNIVIELKDAGDGVPPPQI